MTTVRLSQHSAAAVAAALSLSFVSLIGDASHRVRVRAGLVLGMLPSHHSRCRVFSAALLCAYHKNRFSESLRSRGYGRNQRDSASVALRAAPYAFSVVSHFVFVRCVALRYKYKIYKYKLLLVSGKTKKKKQQKM